MSINDYTGDREGRIVSLVQEAERAARHRAQAGANEKLRELHLRVTRLARLTYGGAELHVKVRPHGKEFYASALMRGEAKHGAYAPTQLDALVELGKVVALDAEKNITAFTQAIADVRSFQ